MAHRINALVSAFFRVLGRSCIAFSLMVSTVQAQEQPSAQDLLVGKAAGSFVMSLSGHQEQQQPSGTPTPKPSVAPTPAPAGPRQGDCPAGQFEISPGVCIGLREPTIPGRPRDLEFELCFKVDGLGLNICQPGYFDCKTNDSGVTTCKLRVIMPIAIPDVKCDFQKNPDGGTDFICSLPDPNSPTDRISLPPGRITYPNDGKVCVKFEGGNELCFNPNEAPFVPEILPKLPGYPKKKPKVDPATKSESLRLDSVSELNTW